jgi:site-specific recombinase XerD
MTATLHQALKRMSTIREGFVVRNLDGSQKTDSEASWAIDRICRKAGLPVHYWHRMRHSYGTHAALFGVNPWRLQGWMGHKRIEETMLYVHVADHHRREIPESILAAGAVERDPDDRIVQMLGARGSHVAAAPGSVEETPVNLAG